jgi:hypothetical protein
MHDRSGLPIVYRPSSTKLLYLLSTKRYTPLISTNIREMYSRNARIKYGNVTEIVQQYLFNF